MSERFESPLAYVVGMMLFLAFAHALGRTRVFGRVVPDHVQRGYNAPLEGLRGVLALAVFFHHAIINRTYYVTGSWDEPTTRLYNHFGLSAVVLFFFLTGFLFWTKLRQQQRLAAGRFYVARARRLIPAYLGSITLLFVIVAVRSDARLRQSAIDLVTSMLKWCSFGLLWDDYPDLNGVINTRYIDAGVIWTLRWEWVFYLVLPALAWFARGRRVAFLGLTLVVAVLSKDARRAIAAIPILKMMLMFLRFFAFGFFPGILASYLVRWERLRSFARQGLAVVLTIACLIGYVFLTEAKFGPHTFLLLIPFTLIACGNDLFGLLSTHALQFLGRISYSVYLLHGIALTVVVGWAARHLELAALSPPRYWLLASGAGALTIVASAISYLVLEAPWMASSSSKPAAT